MQIGGWEPRRKVWGVFSRLVVLSGELCPSGDVGLCLAGLGGEADA